MGVLHRDVKPENFLLSDASPDATVKLADFGLSVFFRRGEPEKEAVGSPYYSECQWRLLSSIADPTPSGDRGPSPGGRSIMARFKTGGANLLFFLTRIH